MKTHIHRISKYTPSIFQGRLDLKAGRHGISLSIEHPFESILVRGLCAALIALTAGYLYFVSASVLNVIARKEALSQVTKIQGAIGDLEQQYFSASQGVTPTTGAALGLSPVEKTQYVYRPGNVAIKNL